MATSIVPVSTSDFLLHPFHSLAVTLATWQERRRQRAGAALLMRFEPHMLTDIGIAPADQRGGARAMLKWHPAVLATTLEPHRQPQEPER